MYIPIRIGIKMVRRIRIVIKTLTILTTGLLPIFHEYFSSFFLFLHIFRLFLNILLYFFPQMISADIPMYRMCTVIPEVDTGIKHKKKKVEISLGASVCRYSRSVLFTVRVGSIVCAKDWSNYLPISL